MTNDQLPNYVGVEHEFKTGVRCRVVEQFAFPQSTEEAKIVYMLKLQFRDGHHEYLFGYRKRPDQAQPETSLSTSAPHHLTVPSDDLLKLIVGALENRWTCRGEGQ
jgi:hypothetical protein